MDFYFFNHFYLCVNKYLDGLVAFNGTFLSFY